MSAIGLSPVRCLTCEKRFYLRSSRVKSYVSEPPKRTFVHTERAQSHGAKPGKAA